MLWRITQARHIQHHNLMTILLAHLEFFRARPWFALQRPRLRVSFNTPQKSWTLITSEIQIILYMKYYDVLIRMRVDELINTQDIVDHFINTSIHNVLIRKDKNTHKLTLCVFYQHIVIIYQHIPHKRKSDQHKCLMINTNV